MEVAVHIAPDFYNESQTQGPHYHALRYNVKPDSISHSRGSLTIQDPAEGGSGVAKFSSSPEETHFNATQSALKEVDCVLIWDETSESYILHRLHSSVKLNKVKTAPKAPMINSAPSHQAVPKSLALSHSNVGTPDLSNIGRSSRPPTPALPSPRLPSASPVMRASTPIHSNVNSPRLGPSQSPAMLQASAARPKTGGKTLPSLPAGQKPAPGLYSSSEESSDDDGEGSSDSSDDFDDLAKKLG